jgi:CO/xanthine dehydrogenase FAD-binding subunit
MRPPPFEYEAVTSLPEAQARLHELGGDAKLLAGGQSLIPLLNLRLAAPSTLIDIGRVTELAGLVATAEMLEIGSMVTHATIEHAADVAARWPMLPAAAANIGHAAIRNRGTVGGSLAHGDPAAEWPVVMLALGATIVAASVGGERRIAAGDFFQSYFVTALEADEVIKRVEVPLPKFGGWSFLELARQSGAFAMVMVAALIDLDKAGAVRDFCIVLGGCAESPIIPRVDPDALIGAKPTPEVFDAVGRQMAAAIEAPTDIRASAEDRRQMAKVLVTRALSQAAARAAEARKHDG